jgi:hypothetical protein
VQWVRLIGALRGARLDLSRSRCRGVKPEMTTRHTNGAIVWTSGNQHISTFAPNQDGTRYTIDRFGEQWSIMFLPHDRADKGHEPVPCLDGPRSLTMAKEAVASHHRNHTERDR